MVAAAAAAGPLAVNPAALAQQLEVLRAHKASRLAARRGGGQNCSLRDMQALLSTSAPRLARVNTRVSGVCVGRGTGVWVGESIDLDGWAGVVAARTAA
jgi:hypothetical protein